MEKNVWGVLIQKPLGTQGKRKTTTPTAPKNQNECVESSALPVLVV